MSNALTEEAAFRIYQRLLDEICEAYFSGDLDAFLRAVHIPHDYSTDDGTHRIDTKAQMEAAFHSCCGYLEGMGVTDYVRTCIGATPISETKIVGGHTSELLRNGTQLREPYEVWSVLELIGEDWKVSGSQNALSDSSWQAQSFRQGAEL